VDIMDNYSNKSAVFMILSTFAAELSPVLLNDLFFFIFTGTMNKKVISYQNIVVRPQMKYSDTKMSTL